MRLILALLLALLPMPAYAASSIAFTISVTGNPDVSKTYTLSDADAAQLVPAYQQGANITVNGTATRTQVLRYMIQTWIDAMKSQVQTFGTIPAQVPPPINPQ